MSEFIKYNKIQNVSSQKLINKITELGLDQQAFEVREKIHGANFSITEFPDLRVAYGKRSGFLEEDETFNNHTKLAADLEQKIANIRSELAFSSQAVITVFGEIFGGTFYNTSETNVRKVQSGVEYHPDIKFMAFDIMVDGVYIEGAKAYRLLANAGFEQAPVIAIVPNLQAALDMPVEFTSMVPQFYGLECKPENLAEGYVIKPVAGDLTIGDHRLILKYKTVHFMENKGTKVGKATIVTLSDADKNQLVDASGYINQVRLDNVLSKESKPVGKDFPKIVGLLIQDALVDYVERVNELYSGAEDEKDLVLKDFIEDPKQFKRELNKLATDLLRGQWADLILEV